MFSLVEAFLMLSYTGMVYVLSCRGFLDVIVHSDGVCSPVDAFLVIVPRDGDVLSCRGFLDVIVHRDGVCSIL